MSSKTRDFSTDSLRKTKKNTIKSRKEKKMKTVKLRGIAESMRRKQIFELPGDKKKSDSMLTKGYQRKIEKIKAPKNKVQKENVKKSEASQQQKKTVRNIVRNVKNAVKHKKHQLVKKKLKIKKTQCSSKTEEKKKIKEGGSNSVSVVNNKVCVVEGCIKVSNNSWIDIENSEQDGANGYNMQLPSVKPDRFPDVDIITDFTNQVTVVDLADLKSKSKRSKKTKKAKRKPSGDVEIIIPPISAKVVDVGHPRYLTSTPKDAHTFFDNTLETSSALDNMDVETAYEKNISSLHKRKISDDMVFNKKSKTKDDSLPDIMNYKFYNVQDPSECLVELPFQSVLAFHGKALIKVIYGSANVLGYQLTNTDEFVPVFSPQSHSALCITAGKIDKDIEDLSKTLDNVGFIDSATKSDIKIQMDTGNCCLLIIKNMEDGLSRYLTSFEEFEDLYQTKLPKTYLRTRNVDIAFSVGLQLMISDKDFEKTLQIPVKYEEVSDTVCRNITDVVPVVLATGKKNVGKSTFCRYLVNTMLNKCTHVYYLECDIGQTEFSPPGFVSLTEVNKPLTGAPFCHQQKSKRMCYFGDVNVTNSPDYYIECVQYVLNFYQQSCANAPLVINTMGWTQDLGLMLLIDTIRLSKPTHIVQITLPVQTVPPPLEAEYLESAEGWAVNEAGNADDQHDLGLARGSVDQDKRVDALQDNIEQLEESGNVVGAQLLQVKIELEHPANQKYKSSDMRILAILSTLFELQPNPVPENPIPIASMVPMVLPWKHVAVCVPHYHVPSSEVLYLLNASIVALCAFDSHQVAMTTEDFNTLKVIYSTPACESFGIGIIRGIDPVNELFYILTSVRVEDLSAVNLLMAGSIAVPKQMLQQGQVADVPYTKRHSTFRETGSAPLKKRKNLKRSNVVRWKKKVGRK